MPYKGLGKLRRLLLFFDRPVFKYMLLYEINPITQPSTAYSYKGYAEKSTEPTQTGQALCNSTACKITTDIPEDALVF